MEPTVEFAQVLHQRVRLRVDPARGVLQGVTELYIRPGKQRVVALHARNLVIDEVRVGSCVVKAQRLQHHKQRSVDDSTKYSTQDYADYVADDYRSALKAERMQGDLAIPLDAYYSAQNDAVAGFGAAAAAANGTATTAAAGPDPTTRPAPSPPPQPSPPSHAPDFSHCSESFRAHLLHDPLLASSIKLTIRYRKLGPDAAVRYMRLDPPSTSSPDPHTSPSSSTGSCRTASVIPSGSAGIMTTDTQFNRARALVPCVDLPGALCTWEVAVEAGLQDVAVCSGALVGQRLLVGCPEQQQQGEEREGERRQQQQGQLEGRREERRQEEPEGKEGKEQQQQERKESGGGGREDGAAAAMAAGAAAAIKAVEGAAGGPDAMDVDSVPPAAEATTATPAAPAPAVPDSAASALPPAAGHNNSSSGTGAAAAADKDNNPHLSDDPMQLDGSSTHLPPTAPPAAPRTPTRTPLPPPSSAPRPTTTLRPPAPQPPRPYAKVWYYEQAAAVAAGQLHVTVGPLAVVPQYQGSTNQLVESFLKQQQQGGPPMQGGQGQQQQQPEAATIITHFGLPGWLDLLVASSRFFYLPFKELQIASTVNFPLPQLQCVWVPSQLASSAVQVAAGVIVVSSELLHSDRCVEDALEARIALVEGLARQWFGVVLQPGSSSDVWLVEGLAGLMADHFLRAWLGQNEVAYRRFKEREAVLAGDDGQLPPLCPQNQYDYSDDGMLGGGGEAGGGGGGMGGAGQQQRRRRKDPLSQMYGSELLDPSPLRRWKAVAVCRMLERRTGEDAFRNIVQALCRAAATSLRSPSPSRGSSDRLLSTRRFISECGAAAGLSKDVAAWAERWVYGRGCPRLTAGFTFVRRSNTLVVAIKQEGGPEVAAAARNASAQRSKSETAGRGVKVAVYDHEGAVQEVVVERMEAHVDAVVHEIEISSKPGHRGRRKRG
ncbi:hypothetical protein Agub_g9063, partial [Astrephomene gubernaculifera]